MAMVSCGKTHFVPGYYRYNILVDIAVQIGNTSQGDLSDSTRGCHSRDCRYIMLLFTSIILFNRCFNYTGDNRLSILYQAAMALFFLSSCRDRIIIGL